MAETENKIELDDSAEDLQGERVFYRIRFRRDWQEFTAESVLDTLLRDDVVMVKTDHGLEPAIVIAKAPSFCRRDIRGGAAYRISRRVTDEENERFGKLPESEKAGFNACTELIEKHCLDMSLVRVEKFFNGSKMIFYFTADNRVDFRELVKDLVQEFRTRVEMRQVGVRHETKMLGGLGTCGRELCCSSFMKKFDSVSIKMAKEQDLPLNPSKISGVCNRLLCCLTYEFANYHEQRKRMPKVGSRVKLDGVEYKVKRQIPLKRQVVVVAPDNGERVLDEDNWLNMERVKSGSPAKKKNRPS
ncbi:MAG: regulatory iron-sulfur-containing complex subunit RicT [Desulfopila sp.]|jgi:cell fate regulator YaaT (PSP1 superfamily)|nr:regulatory iron-sulfur-containing complex subunit RicT [Desulfopila sp.]